MKQMLLDIDYSKSPKIATISAYRGIPVVYMMYYKNGDIKYIGLSTDFFKRYRAHRASGILSDVERIELHIMRNEFDMFIYEAQEIFRLSPPFNKDIPVCALPEQLIKPLKITDMDGELEKSDTIDYKMTLLRISLRNLKVRQVIYAPCRKDMLKIQQ